MLDGNVDKALQQIGVDVVEPETNETESQPYSKNMVIASTQAETIMTVQLELITKEQANIEFDEERIKKQFEREMSLSDDKYTMSGFEEYAKTLNYILTSIRLGQKLNSSYIIGAPNGMGKTSFAVNAIKLMYSNKMKPAPYVSLYELAELRVENDRRILRSMNKRFEVEQTDAGESNEDFESSEEYVKYPVTVVGAYSWSEYMSADILFCFLSSVQAKEVESKILRMILEIRAAKSLPTVVMTSTSLMPYTSSERLNRFVWEDIIPKDTKIIGYDRLKHVSCFKRYERML